MSHDDQQFQLGKASGTGNRLKSRRVSFVTKRWRDEDTKKQKKKKKPQKSNPNRTGWNRLRSSSGRSCTCCSAPWRPSAATTTVRGCPRPRWNARATCCGGRRRRRSRSGRAWPPPCRPRCTSSTAAGRAPATGSVSRSTGEWQCLTGQPSVTPSTIEKKNIENPI